LEKSNALFGKPICARSYLANSRSSNSSVPAIAPALDSMLVRKGFDGRQYG
jgi:hypothetical protein